MTHSEICALTWKALSFYFVALFCYGKTSLDVPDCVLLPREYSGTAEVTPACADGVLRQLGASPLSLASFQGAVLGFAD